MSQKYGITFATVHKELEKVGMTITDILSLYGMFIPITTISFTLIVIKFARSADCLSELCTRFYWLQEIGLSKGDSTILNGLILCTERLCA